MRKITALILGMSIWGTAEARPRKRVPLTVRTNNPCALTYSYHHAPAVPAGLVAILRAKKIRVEKGPPDRLGNRVMYFRTVADGEQACVILWQENYGNHNLARAIASWSGHNSPRAYAQYVSLRTGIPLRGRLIKDLSPTQMIRLRQAQREWESGRTKQGRIGAPKKKSPPRAKVARRK